jgi:hypothetical protein
VGLTDQWVHQRVSTEHYRLWCAKLSDLVKNCFGEGNAAEGQQQQQRDNNSTAQRAPSRARIVADRDYRCVLLNVNAAVCVPVSSGAMAKDSQPADMQHAGK